MKKILLMTLVLYLSIGTAHAMPIISTFDINDEGWIADGAGIFHEFFGGNPGGFLRIEDNRDDTFSVFAPSKFLGDLSLFDGGWLSYDILQIFPTELTSIGSGFGRIQLLGGDSNATFDYAPNPSIPSSQFWKTYEVPLTASAWNTTQENWEKIISNVTRIDIILEPINFSTVGLDNFQITPVPEPASMLFFGNGLAGMILRRRFKKLRTPSN